MTKERDAAPRIIMTDARIGRLLTACLHQAISDLSPERLDFYEEWLRSDALRGRGRGLGLAPMTAVLGFLRLEVAYGQIVERAGQLAAEWTIAAMPPLQRRIIARLPRRWRARAALRVAARIVRDVCSGSRASTRVRRADARLDVRDSIFCTVREAPASPLCGFYVAAVTSTLGAFKLPVRARIERCRAMQGASCVIALDLSEAPLVADPALAA